MKALGIRKSLGVRHSVSARIRNANFTVPHDEVDVCFVLLDLSNGPEIDCDPETMKGYGIPFGNFRPWFQRFSFDKATRELRISSDNPRSKYDFVLCFDL